LDLQTVRSNEQMMQSMKGATMLLGSMNRQMNLPALQRIAMEFERENEIMDQRQEMMDDAIDEATGLEDEEESEEIVKEVLDEIGVDLGQAVRTLILDLRSLHGPLSMLTKYHHRWERLLQVFRRMQLMKEESHKPLVAVEMQMMTISRPDSIVSGDEAKPVIGYYGSTAAAPSGFV
jgi:hypothetical protein